MPTNPQDAIDKAGLHALPPTALFTRPEAAAYLDVSQSALEKWAVERRNLPFAKIGKLVKYKKRDLDAFVELHTVAVTTV